MSKSIGFGVIGAGRIGNLHARHIAGAIDGAHLVTVMDADLGVAQKAAFAGAKVTQDVNDIFNDSAIDAVLIASPTFLHAEQVKAAAKAGKMIFCEKPVDLDLAKTIEAMKLVDDTGVPFQIGFNRRFDPGYAELARAVKAGELGRCELFRSQSSDPAPPPEAYIKVSGGLYIDSVIHDIDTARFVVGDIKRVTALGRSLTDPVFARNNDIDTSVLTLEFESGALGVIMNSRRTVYGYDLRVEVFGEKGKFVTEDERATKVWKYHQEGIKGDFYYYFIERFRDAYRAELQAFVDAVRKGEKPAPGTKDAVESLRVAIAATRSLREGRPVEISEIKG
jgi:myo-inositol 2-dehydrogenase/D-chiro-inositol 1-dehydrogenase